MTISGRVDFASGAPAAGDLDVAWIHGSRSAKRNTDPKIQVHACDPHTFVLRQSKAVHYEAPFFYLFCGNDRALLLDTGATSDPAACSIAVYDPWTGFLITGDTVYPGRLYVRGFPAFIASLDRLVDFARARPVTHVLGCHIEMSRFPGRDYPVGATYQPDEAALPMTVKQLTAVRDAARSVAGRRGAHAFGDFTILVLPSTLAVTKQAVRALAWKLRNAIPL